MFDVPVAAMKVPAFAVKALFNPRLRGPSLRCARNALVDFFGVQWRARFSPGITPISNVDHPLDELVPFAPRWVGIYMDFIAFWIRTAAWLRNRYGRKGDREVAAFIEGVAGLYESAASVYRARLSTTRRPFYVARPRFALIHLTDPHYACVPSLHVMIVVYAWIAFRDAVRRLGDESAAGARVRELRAGALAITESILYVKQHSVNCVSAALYVMTKLFPAMLGQAEAEAFIGELFLAHRVPAKADGELVRAHIVDLYRRFLAEAGSTADWRRPLVDFLAGLETRPGLYSAAEDVLRFAD